MGKDNVVFPEVLEWLDPTGREVAHRIPEGGVRGVRGGGPGHRAGQPGRRVLLGRGGLRRPRPRDVEAVVRCRVRVRAARLVLLAFRPRGGEWVEETAGAPVPAAALERGRLI